MRTKEERNRIARRIGVRRATNRDGIGTFCAECGFPFDADERMTWVALDESAGFCSLACAEERMGGMGRRA